MTPNTTGWAYLSQMDTQYRPYLHWGERWRYVGVGDNPTRAQNLHLSRCFNYFEMTIVRILFWIYCNGMVEKSEYRDLFPGALELMILQTLNRKPMHGYALAQHIKDISDDLLQIEEGSLYPALQRMLKTGWLESEMGLSARKRPVRVFKVTEAGRKHLEDERSSFEKMFAGITRVLAVAQT